MRSIFWSSSSVKAWRLIFVVFSMICAGLDAPIRTEVSASSLRIQFSAICARLSPRSCAMSFKAEIFCSISGVRLAAVRYGLFFWIRLPCGIPCRYLSVKSPCASGLNAIIPSPSFGAVSFSPFFSIVRSKMEYLF